MAPYYTWKLFLSGSIWKSNDLTKNKQQRSQPAFIRPATALSLPCFIYLALLNQHISI